MFSIIMYSQEENRPNFLVILADDLGYGDLGYTGTKDISTPNIDWLAKQGVEITNGYVTHPYCGPSRAGLITGRYQARFGLEINITNSHFDEHSGLPTTEKTFASRLKKVGYTTGIIGKWHLGASYLFHPNNRGFDYFYGFLSGGHSYFPENVNIIRSLRVKGNLNNEPHYSANEGAYWPLLRNNKNGEFNEYLTTALSKDAVKFVSQVNNKPFMLYLAYNAPHAPLEAPKKTIEKYAHIKDKRRRIYAAMIDEMDQGIGLIIEALKKTKKLDNTVIFFLSDNGGARPKINKKTGNMSAYSNSGLYRDGKGSMREGGSHVPFIIHWPKGIKRTGKFDGLVSALDIAATVTYLGKGDTSGYSLEGKNLIPYLNGVKKESPHQELFWRTEIGRWSVRNLDTKYLLNDETGIPELYDMKNDPYETTDILSRYPRKRKKMAKLWNDWNKKNINNVLLQANVYQKMRLKFYKDLHESLEQKATKKPIMIIE
ncbi:sulfatase [Flavivirga aquatica]|uniref:Sulfatase n=1 Tax=Flavivirga aquatica TaxID=1849968 RepID=A0A1E5T4A2_9FLAO|nr:sulfatase-like hydrolase/transferase [Flavivirga aquatica]OEK06186.1 sulfatase [Flavivirga aquatica]